MYNDIVMRARWRAHVLEVVASVVVAATTGTGVPCARAAVHVVTAANASITTDSGNNTTLRTVFGKDGYFQSGKLCHGWNPCASPTSLSAPQPP